MPAQKESTLKTQEQPVEVLAVREVKTLVSWQAPTRVFKTRTREFWTTLLSIVFLLAVILFFLKEVLLIVVMVAMVFVYYVLTTVPPEEIEYTITNRGVRFAGKEYLWEEISQYWISASHDQKILNFATRIKFPGRLEFLLGHESEDKMRDLLKKYLPEEVPNPSFLEKASNWLAKKIPLEIS